MVNTRDARNWMQLAQELEDRANRIRQMIREECTHRQPCGEFFTLKDGGGIERCLGCDSVISRNDRGEIIVLRKTRG